MSLGRAPAAATQLIDELLAILRPLHPLPAQAASVRSSEARLGAWSGLVIGHTSADPLEPAQAADATTGRSAIDREERRAGGQATKRRPVRPTEPKRRAILKLPKPHNLPASIRMSPSLRRDHWERPAFPQRRIDGLVPPTTSQRAGNSYRPPSSRSSSARLIAYSVNDRLPCSLTHRKWAMAVSFLSFRS